MKYPGFIGPSYRPQSPAADTERLVCWYVEKNMSAHARSEFAFYPTPGAQTFASATDGAVRAAMANRDRAFFVIGPTFQECATSGALTSRGAITIDERPATITTNGDNQIFVTSGKKGYVVDWITGVLTQVLASGADQGGMLDLFFLALDAATGTLGISASDDATSWPGDQKLQRQTAPDPWKAFLVANNKIYIGGDQTTDVLYNAGTSPVPFAPFAGATIPHGIAAAASMAEANGAVTWLSQTVKGSYQVVRATGYASADRISHYGVEAAIASYARVDDAEAFTLQWFGHEWYVLSFPSGNATWVFDETTGWFELGTWDPDMNRYDAWRPRCHAFVFNQHLVGDRTTGTIAQLRADVGTDVGGGVIRRMRIGPPLGRDQRRPGRVRPVIVDRFSVELESGLGVASGQGVDPQILFTKSKDGGKTWGPYRSRSAGAMGRYGVVPTWGRVGAALDFVPQIVVTDPIPWRLVGADLQLRGAA